MKRNNNAMTTFNKDAKNFAVSLANHNRIIGEFTGTYDTVKKGKKLVASGSKVIKSAKRQMRSNVNLYVRKVKRYLP